MNIVDTSIVLSLIGGEEVSLDIGFDAPSNSELWVLIDTCEAGAKVQLIEPPTLLKDRMKEVNDILTVISKKESQDHVIQFKLEKPEKVQLDIMDKNGKVVSRLVDYEYKNKGIFLKRIRTTKLEPGVYTIVLRTPTIEERERLTVLN
jgi:hypothetical protein